MSSPPVWDIVYVAKKPSASIPDWYPASWTRTLFQRIKFLQVGKQKADAILRAAQVLSFELPQQLLIQETDNVGRKFFGLLSLLRTCLVWIVFLISNRPSKNPLR